LVDDIVEMLLGQSERVIHQDAIISLQRLMGDQPRLEAYQRLMGGPEAGYALAVALDGLDPADALRLLAAYVRESSESPGYLRRDEAPAILAAVPPEQLKGDVLQAGVEVGALLGFDQELLIGLREADRAAALAGMASVIAEHDLSWYEAIRFMLLFEVDELRQAGVPGGFIEKVEQHRQVEAESAQLIAEGAIPLASDEPEEEGESEPTLGELLDDQRSDAMILNNSRYFAPQVGDLSPSQLCELRRRLERWWPKKPFASTITRTNSNSWRQEAGAAAWVWLGPAARPPLSPRQWGELASCGILFSNQSEWLTETQSLEGAYEAIEAIGSDGDPERWSQLLGASEDPLPNLLLERCADTLDPEATADSDSLNYRLASIAQRFVMGGRDDLARRLAARVAAFAEILSPVLAEHGDLEAQRKMFGELKRTLDEGKLPDDHRLSWMGGVRETVMLPELFEILRRTYKLSDRPMPSVRMGFELHDLITPVTETINQIGGREAVAGYDELIDAGGDFRWLGPQRDRVAGVVLSRDGERFAAQAATQMGLPSLGDEAAAG
jgi:hypothetical protein